MGTNKYSCETTIIWRKFPEVKPEREDFYMIFDPSDMDDNEESPTGFAFYSMEQEVFLLPDHTGVINFFEGVAAWAELPDIPNFEL